MLHCKWAARWYPSCSGKHHLLSESIHFSLFHLPNILIENPHRQMRPLPFISDFFFHFKTCASTSLSQRSKATPTTSHSGESSPHHSWPGCCQLPLSKIPASGADYEASTGHSSGRGSSSSSRVCPSLFYLPTEAKLLPLPCLSQATSSALRPLLCSYVSA